MQNHWFIFYFSINLCHVNTITNVCFQWHGNAMYNLCLKQIRKSAERKMTKAKEREEYQEFQGVGLHLLGSSLWRKCRLCTPRTQLYDTPLRADPRLSQRKPLTLCQRQNGQKVRKESNPCDIKVIIVKFTTNRENVCHLFAKQAQIYLPLSVSKMLWGMSIPDGA